MFCGSKQPAQAPAEIARTVMGYSANQVRDHAAAAAAMAPRHPPSAPPPMGGPAVGPAMSAGRHPPSAPPPMGGPAAGPAMSAGRHPPTAPPPMGGPAAGPAMSAGRHPPTAPPPMGGPAAGPAMSAGRHPPSAPPPMGGPPNPAFGGPGFGGPGAPGGYPAAPSAPAFPPPAAANAATMFAPSSGGPGPQPQSPAAGGSAASPAPLAATMAAPLPVFPASTAGAYQAQPSGPSGYPPAGASYQAGAYHAQGGGYGAPGGGGYGAPGGGGYGAPGGGGYGAPGGGGYGAPAGGYGAPGYASGPSTPMHQPAYLASETADRAARPIDPYRDGLRLVLFAFGILLLGAFCTPLSNDLTFHWNVVIDAPTTAKVASLLLAVVGALSIILASTPLASPLRGGLAAGLGLLGLIAPLALAKVSEWRLLVAALVPMLLIPGLLLRQEYREQLLPRLLATLGVLGALAIWLVPSGDALPLVATVKAVVDASGVGKVPHLLELVHLVVIVLCLLVWLPAPSGAGAKLLAWLLIFWAALMHFQMLILSENLGEQLKATPFDSAMSWAPGVAYLALLGYGLAAALGKQLETA
ncbi:MAG: hypothetical protein R3B48_24610 [Kofleriaceae bacterium]